MPSPSKGAPDCSGVRDVVGDIDVRAEELRADAVVEEGTLVEDRLAAEVPNMKPTMSSTAAGSRITVYLPAGTARGSAESSALRPAMSAIGSGSRLVMLGEFAFCQPEEFFASIVMEISADVCVCQSAMPRELKIPSMDSELE